MEKNRVVNVFCVYARVCTFVRVCVFVCIHLCEEERGEKKGIMKSEKM